MDGKWAMAAEGVGMVTMGLILRKTRIWLVVWHLFPFGTLLFSDTVLAPPLGREVDP